MSSDARYYRSRVEKLFERRNKKSAVRSEILRRVHRQRLAAGATESPTDLDKFCRYLGVSDVRYVPLSMKGRLVRGEQGLSIEINEQLDPFWRRLTLAHELVHVILEGDATAEALLSPRKNSSRGASAIEDICDLGAAEILLPAAALRQRAFSHPPSLEEAAAIADQSKCDTEWVIGRAISLALWKVRLMVFEIIVGSFNVVRTVPAVDRAFLASIHPAPQTTRLFQRAVASSAPFHCQIELKTADGDFSYPAELRSYRKRQVTALIHYV